MTDSSGRYQLQDRIAIGGTAEVFRALLMSGDGSQRPVVIKRVLPQFARDERFRRLFDEEARVAMGVDHPNIVGVLDHGTMGETCFIAMELVEGKNLAQLLTSARDRGRELPTGLAAYVTAQVGEALSFIHHRTSSGGTPLKIIHRDVSPQNILVSWAGEVKLTDFGIAKSIVRQEKTVDGTLRGKLEYMAPEQARLSEVDHRADIFSLGCVLYEMIQGAPPFRGDNELETLERLRRGVMEISPMELPTEELLVQVLVRALALRREDRYQKARELVGDLDLFIERQARPLGPEVLALWVKEVATAASPPAVNAVDLAVQRLLGQSVDEPPPAPVATSVFASAPPAAEPPRAAAPGATAEPTARAPRKPLNLVLLVVAALGSCGWLLWAYHHFTQEDRPTPVASVRPDARPSPALPARPPPGDLGSGPTPAPPAGTDKPRRSKPRPRATGSITINSLPWSRVRLDGKAVGDTPVVRLRLTAGKHRLELLSPKGKVRKSLRIEVPVGRNKTYSFDLTKTP